MKARLSLAVFAALALSTGAQAQRAQIAAVVNDQIITELDVQRRLHLLQAQTHGKATPRKEAIDELVDERLKLSEARKLKVTVSDAEVDGVFKAMAERSKAPLAQFSEMLNRANIGADHLKTRIRAELGWRKVLQQKLRGRINFRDSDIAAALGKSRDEPGTTTEYTLQQVIFVTPQSAGEAYKAQRKREAEALRTRFNGCAQDLPKLKGLRDVVVRDVGRKRGSDLGKELQESLDATAVGRLTKPNPTSTGVELVAVCGKRTVKDEKVGSREAREEVMEREYQVAAKKVLAELRQNATIDVR